MKDLFSCIVTSAAVGTFSSNRFDHWFSLLVADSTFCMIKKKNNNMMMIQMFVFSFFFFNFKLITVFTLLDGMFLYIISFFFSSSCTVLWFCTPEVSAIVSENIEHEQESGCVCFYSHSFSFCTASVLLSFGSDVGFSVNRRFRGAFSVWCVFFSFFYHLFFVFSVSFLGELNYSVNENML